ncbi:Hypothetical protein PBPRA2134 [Photobacterium profundum SS9]|uniref:Uncharacterized protein n=1 Tax=Photobacterium profundum (strain SS9) TaxID=298386 RepID=Q6LQ94_PHOPR|nr:Hypothetical protein PBPRA2134 [Photobacterium profundum SS9]
MKPSFYPFFFIHLQPPMQKSRSALPSRKNKRGLLHFYMLIICLTNTITRLDSKSQKCCKVAHKFHQRLIRNRKLNAGGLEAGYHHHLYVNIQ